MFSSFFFLSFIDKDYFSIICLAFTHSASKLKSNSNPVGPFDHLLYILTSIWVLHTPKAGSWIGRWKSWKKDQHLGANLKNKFFLLNFASIFMLFFLFSFLLCWWLKYRWGQTDVILTRANNDKKCWKSRFIPAFGVHSTQMLVKICKSHFSKQTSR